MRKYFIFYFVLSCLIMTARGQAITDLADIDLSGVPQSTQAKALRYWFDDDATSIQFLEVGTSVYTLDVSPLTEGVHTLHVQVIGLNDESCYIASSLFMIIGNIKADGDIKPSKLMYWYDDEETIHSIDMSDGAIILDASTLTEGLHTIHYQVLCNNGLMTASKSSIFLNMNSDTNVAIAKSLRYWFDEDASTVIVTDVSNGAQTLDVSNLLAGIHTLYYQIIDDKGNVTTPVARLFIKSFDTLPDRVTNSVTKYQYWLNNNSQAAQTVALNDSSNPYTLIGLLPVQTENISSSLFHFEMEDDQPMVFSKNIFRIRFYDALGYFNEGEKEYIDYRVKQMVDPVGELQSQQTFPKVENNDIRWYTVNVEAGDTLAFKSSQATTLQLFSPSGKELYKAEGVASVTYGGCHTWETGTHYLAVHDVTGTRPNMTLDYIHMDKYDVVDWDVHTVGNGGCSTITFKGNGFRDLYAVDLYTAEGDTIHSVDVSHDNDAETAVTFDFMGATLDEYNAMFHFTEEDKNIAKAITVEEATDINLVTDVSFPSTFLRGTSTTYTIKITNLGNMTAYQVPLDIQIATNSQSAITNIRFSDNIPPVNVDWMDTLTITKEEIDLVREFIKEKGDLLHFTTSYDSLNNKYVKVCLMALRISPNTTTNITLNIASVERVDVRVKTTDVMNPVYTYNIYEIKRQYLKRRASFTETMCCYREKVECVMNVIVSLADFASIFAGPQGKLATCIADLGNTVLQFSYDVWCGEEHGGKDFGKAADDLVWDAVNGLVGCATNIPGLKKLGTLDWIYQHIYNNIKTTMDCVSSLSQKIPNCPPCTTCGGGGGSTPQPPVDPNDIYGYLSESGSKFIADSVARVNYTIEFENDTTFATAAAHTIVIKDTLDSRYFDLNTFVPTGVRIGRKEVQLSEADVQSSKGVTSFVKTVDMRPEIYAIAQVEGEYIHKTGIATWTFQSLDPMTMEPTDELMQGILPVNYDGTSGIGEVMFEVGMKSGKADGTEIPNRAGIVFDYEQPIITPTWTNIVDATVPTSRIIGGVQPNDSTLTLKLQGEDNLSGVWKYDVYAQAGESAPWELVAASVTDSTCDVRIYEGIEYGFLVLATDSAGNVEKKAFEPELVHSTVTLGDANGDGTVDALDVVLATSYYLGNNVYLNFAATDVVADGEINSLDVVAIQNIYLNTTSGGKTLAPRRRRVKHK